MVCGCSARDTDRAEPVTLPPPIERTVLSQLAFRDRALPADALAADGFEPDHLAALLESAGYVGGREREFTGHTTTFDHVVARTLRFARPSGATDYLRWIATHTSDLVGPTHALQRLPVGDDAILVELEPCPTCKKQLPTLVAAWRRGSSVGYVVAAGRDADRHTIQPLVEAVDTTVAGASG